MPAKPVLCALELCEAASAVVAHARSVADAMGAPLHGVHVCDVPESPLPSDVQDALERAEDALRSLLGGASRAEAHVRVGLTSTQVLAVAARIEAQLVVVNTRSRGALPRALLGSTAEAVVKSADRAVLVLPDGVPWNPPRTVLVGCDLEDESTLDAASRLGAERVHVVHAVGPDGDAELTGEGASSLHRRAHEAAGAQLESIVQAVFGADAPHVSTHLASRTPLAAIQDAVGQFRPDLVVVGRSRRSMLGRVFMGTTSIKLLREGAAPIMMVPPT